MITTPIAFDMSQVEQIGFIKFDIPGYDCDVVIERSADTITVKRYDRGRWQVSETHTLSAEEFAHTILKIE